jgi:hypothetical protein
VSPVTLCVVLRYVTASEKIGRDQTLHETSAVSGFTGQSNHYILAREVYKQCYT